MCVASSRVLECKLVLDNAYFERSDLSTGSRCDGIRAGVTENRVENDEFHESRAIVNDRDASFGRDTDSIVVEDEL